MPKKRKPKTSEQRVVDVVKSVRPAANQHGKYEGIKILKATAVLLGLPNFEHHQ